MARPPRKIIDCPNPQELPVDASAPFRPVPKCDPPAVPVEPDYVSPAPVTGAPIVRALPAPLVFQSPEVTVTCDDWTPAFTGAAPTGDPVVIPAGEFSDSLFIQNLDLERDDIYYITDALARDEDAVMELIVTGDAVELSRIFNISQTDAQTIIDAAEVIIASLAAQAQELALSRLDCLWWNEVQLVYCPTGAILDSNNPSVVAAHTYSSTISQADANQQARTEAEGQLTCRYTNERQTVVCSDLSSSLSDLDPGNTDQFAGQSPLSAPQRVFVNTISIEAAQFFSEISAEDANLQAREYALTLLSCFYIQNVPVTATCDADAQSVAADIRPVDYDGSSVGNPVTVVRHYTYSDSSMQDALDLAMNLAETSLECKWSCCQMTYSCDDRMSDPSDPVQVSLHCAGGSYDDPLALANKAGTMVYVSAFERELEVFAIPAKSGGGYSYTVDAAAFRSDVSYAEANSSAANYALTQLQCIYCNPHIESSCPPLSITYTIKVDGVSYFIDGNIDNGVQERPSIDFLGAAGDGPFVFCGSNPQTVVFQADEIGKVAFKDLITLDTVCEFQNDDTYTSCYPDIVAAQPDTWLWANPQTGLPENRPTQKLIFPLNDLATSLSPNSTQGVIFVEHGSFTADSLAEANAMAAAFATAQLDCFYENELMPAECPDGPDVSPLLKGHFEVDPGRYRSYDTKADANQQALTAAESMLVCMYCNGPGIGTTECPIIEIAVCTCFSSISQEDADDKAWALLAAILAARTLCPGDPGYPGGGGGGGGSDSGSTGSLSGSSKSTAIVPASWTEGQHTALFTLEAPEVRFDDVMRVEITGPVTRVMADPRYLEVCEPGVVIDSATGDTGPVVCARMEGRDVVVETAKRGRRPKFVVVRLTGVRKGFAGMRFPNRSARQFEANEAFLNSAYPAEP